VVPDRNGTAVEAGSDADPTTGRRPHPDTAQRPFSHAAGRNRRPRQRCTDRPPEASCRRPRGSTPPTKNDAVFGKQDFMAMKVLSATALTTKAQVTGLTAGLIEAVSDGTSRSGRRSSLGRVAWSASLGPDDLVEPINNVG